MDCCVVLYNIGMKPKALPMMIRSSPIIKKVLCLVCLLFVIDLASSPGDSVLARLDKPAGTGIPARLSARIQVLQELASSWIVSIPKDAKAGLEAMGFSCEVLDAAPSGKTYFLVFTPRRSDAAVLEKFGRTRILDEETSLFWTDEAREAREVLPAEFKIKSLALTDRLAISLDETAADGRPRAPGGILKPPFYVPLIGLMVDQVTSANLSGIILQLQSFSTRYASTAGCALAGDYLLNYFTQLGLACESDPFSFSSYSSRNIIATLPGKVFPQYVVLIGAHYDSYSNQAATAAPGADDNASGTAAVMEIARILSQYRFDFTLKFVCFSAEEWGLYGSKHYAQEAKARGVKLIGVINMDMIAFTDRLPEDLDLVVNQSSQWLANRFSICAAQYVSLPLLKVVNANLRWSDHSPFWDQGFSAVCGIEDYGAPNPYYHKPTDLYTTLNMDFATSVTKIVLAVAAGLAQTSIQ